MARQLPLILALALTTPVAIARAAPTSPHEDAAARAFDAGDLETAAREFEAAFAETGRADLLYAIGRMHAARGDCPRAIEHFRRFLATGPGPRATDSARAEIEACEAVLAAAAPAEPPPAAPAAPAPVTATPVRGGGGFYRDALGTVLVGSGVVAGISAIVLYGKAIDAQCGDPVCSGVSYDQYLADRESADRWRMRAVVVGGVGGALIVGGVVRYALQRRPSRPVDLGVIPARGGASLVVGGQF